MLQKKPRSSNPVTSTDYQRLLRAGGSAGPWLSRRIFTGLTRQEALRFLRVFYSAVLEAFPKDEPLIDAFRQTDRLLHSKLTAPTTRVAASKLLKKLCSQIMKMSRPVEKVVGRVAADMLLATLDVLIYIAKASYEQIDNFTGNSNQSIGGFSRSEVYLRPRHDIFDVTWLSTIWLGMTLGKLVGINEYIKIKMRLIQECFREHEGVPPPGAASPAEYYSNYPPARGLKKRKLLKRAAKKVIKKAPKKQSVKAYRFCKKCTNTLKPGWVACPYCGTRSSRDKNADSNHRR